MELQASVFHICSDRAGETWRDRGKGMHVGGVQERKCGNMMTALSYGVN